MTQSLFKLIGIACSEKDYRLSYFINKELNIDLQKQSEPVLAFLNKTQVEVPYFYSDELDYEYFMLPNSLKDFKILPKFKTINFWLFIKQSPNFLEKIEVEKKLSKINVILTSVPIYDEAAIKTIHDIFFA